MAGAGAGLLSASPHRPAQAVGGVSSGTGEQRGEQVLQLVAGQADQVGWWRVAGAAGGGQDHKEGVGEHGQRHPAVPGAPAADLMLVQADQALAGLDALFHRPAPPRTVTRTASGVGRGIQQW